MNPQIRQLRKDIAEKAARAAELLSPDRSAEDHKRGEALMAETTTMEQRLTAFETAERANSGGVREAEEQEARDQEELRRQAEAAAQGATGSRGTAQTTAGEEEREEVAEAAVANPATDDEVEQAQSILRMF